MNDVTKAHGLSVICSDCTTLYLQAPLGKLTTNQIKSGYEALKIIEDCIVKNKTGSKQHLDACNQFYTRWECFASLSPTSRVNATLNTAMFCWSVGSIGAVG